jgi:hypothetical protein
MLLLWAFLIGVVVDSIPVFAPPAWSVLVILIVKYKGNPWGVLVFGVAGSTLGRYIPMARSGDPSRRPPLR